MAEAISFVPIESEGAMPDGTEGGVPDTPMSTEGGAPDVTPESVPAGVPADAWESEDAPAVPEAVLLKKTRAKAKAKEPKVLKEKVVKPKPLKARIAPLKVVTIREEAPEQETYEPSFENTMLQHMLNHRMRQRTQREELYKTNVASF